jgi:hypothetical protein
MYKSSPFGLLTLYVFEEAHVKQKFPSIINKRISTPYFWAGLLEMGSHEAFLFLSIYFFWIKILIHI